MYSKTMDPAYIQEITHYNDGDILNKFYQSLEQCAQGLAQKEDTLDNLNFHYESFVVSARALHALYTTQHKHSILVCGTAHCATINYFLHKLGWILEEQLVPATLNSVEKKAVESVINIASSHDTVIDAMETFFDNFTTNIDLVRGHGIDAADIIIPAHRGSFWQKLIAFIEPLLNIV
jgi:hypothetical protein